MTATSSVIDIAMPRLSDSMEEATIVRWLCATGDHVDRGQEIVEIETDKATVTHEAEAAGVLEPIEPEGSTVALGITIARIHPSGTPMDATNPVDDANRSAPEPTTAAATNARHDSPAKTGGTRSNASPVARRAAAELGVDLSTIDGTGPSGRIVKADVLEASASSPPSLEPEPGVDLPRPSEGLGRGEVTIQALSRGQRTVSLRMTEAKTSIPEFTTTMDVDMREAIELRTQLRAAVEPATPPSLNDFVVKAVALSLREFPRANGRYRDDAFELYSRVNVGIAVSHPDGLMVPVVRDVDAKGLGTIAGEARRLAERVRDGSIAPADLDHGTFTVSNLGMLGVSSFSAIINQWQACILAVGAVEERPVVREGAVAARPMMTLTLSADHRILYGTDAAEFLASVRDHLQAPMKLLL